MGYNEQGFSQEGEDFIAAYQLISGVERKEAEKVLLDCENAIAGRYMMGQSAQFIAEKIWAIYKEG